MSQLEDALNAIKRSADGVAELRSETAELLANVEAVLDRQDVALEEFADGCPVFDAERLDVAWVQLGYLLHEGRRRFVVQVGYGGGGGDDPTEFHRAPWCETPPTFAIPAFPQITDLLRRINHVLSENLRAEIRQYDAVRDVPPSLSLARELMSKVDAAEQHGP